MVETVRYSLAKMEDLDLGTGYREERLQDGRTALLTQIGLHRFLAEMTSAHMVEEFGTLEDTVLALGSSPCEIWVTKAEQVNASLTIPATCTLKIFRGGSITVTAGTLTIHTMQAGNWACLATSGSGAITIAPQTIINPVWFTTAGSGTTSSPWTSTDGTCGHAGAFAAMQQFGTMEGPSGEYSWTAGAVIDLDNITLRWHSYAHHVPTGNVVMVTLNGGADPGETGTNNHSIVVEGGFWDTGSENTTLNGTAFFAPRCRNITIQKCRFRRLICPINIPSADTMRIRDNFFRTSSKCVYFPNYMHTEGVTPQDIWIQHNSFSGEDDTNVMQCVLVESVISALYVEYNGAALGYNDATNNTLGKFVQICTGALDASDGVTEYESGNIHILHNATEQAGDTLNPGTRQTLVRIHDTGASLDCSDVYIKENDFGSPYAKILDLNRTAGVWHIIGNQFQHAGAWAIDLDQVRPDAVVIIDGNKFLQDSGSTGVNWEITNVTTTGQVFIGRNSYVQASGSIGTMTHPTLSGRVVFTPLVPALNNVSQAATISIRPWIGKFGITGTGNVDNLEITWEGHEVLVQVGTGVTLRDNSAGAGNFRFDGDANIAGGTNVFVKLHCTGVFWGQLTPRYALG